MSALSFYMDGRFRGWTWEDNATRYFSTFSAMDSALATINDDLRILRGYQFELTPILVEGCMKSTVRGMGEQMVASLGPVPDQDFRHLSGARMEYISDGRATSRGPGSRAGSRKPNRAARKTRRSSSRPSSSHRNTPSGKGSQIPTRRPRYANAALLDPSGKRILKKNEPLGPKQVILLRLDIGKKSSESQVVRARPLPLPRTSENFDLDVMISSTDLGAADEEKALAGARPSIAHGRFTLPGSGEAATAQDGGKYLRFFLKMPPRKRKRPQFVRIGYYYKTVLLQSQRITIRQMEKPGFAIETDFTTTNDLTGLDLLPTRPRISILTNDNSNGHHQIVIRGRSGASAPLSSGTIEIREAALACPIRESAVICPD